MTPRGIVPLVDSKATTDLAKAYLASIKREIETGNATEHTYRPALKELIETLDNAVTAINEPKRVDCGAPDFVVKRRDLSIGYIEAKDAGKSLDEAEDTDQLRRYRKSLHNLILTDYLEFRWYVDGEPRGKTRLARLEKGNKIILDMGGIKETINVLSDFLSHNPSPIANSKELSQRLARLAHIIRDIIVEAFDKGKASDDLNDLRNAFAQVLIHDINQPKNTKTFADMYAQTMVYGLFAARVNHVGSEPFRRLGAANEIPKTNPFLKNLFETITGTALDDAPYADFVEDLVQLLANTDIQKVLENFGRRTRKEDPIVHFYETFLESYDPDLRQKRGVYYTPEPIVFDIVRSVDHILKSRFGLHGGLVHTSDFSPYEREEAFLDKNGNLDRNKLPQVIDGELPSVLILDPACGTGTFLYSVMDHIRAELMKLKDAGMWQSYVKDHLLPRLFGFEFLMAPYAIAHFKMGLLLEGYDLPKEQQKIWRYKIEDDQRLGIFLTNTLEEAPSEWQKLFGAYRILSKEANAASVVKRDLPVMVIIGNPPYAVGSSNKGEYIERLMERYKKAVRKEKNIQPVSNDYIKFIRFAHDRIDRTGYGIIGMITANSYLSGLVFRGVREELMKSFDEIYILNLHGSTRETHPDGRLDENVFEITQGTSIAFFIKYKNNSGHSIVNYAELWGTIEEKYQYLTDFDISTTKWQSILPVPPYFFFVPNQFQFQEEYDNLWQVGKIFRIFSTGTGTGRDSSLVAFEHQFIDRLIQDLYNKDIPDEKITEIYDIRNTSGWNFFGRRREFQTQINKPSQISEYHYRPFDIRYIFYHPVLRRDQRKVMKNMEHQNLGLLTCQQQAVQGYRHVSCTNNIVDESVLSTGTKERGYIFPLYIYPEYEGRIVNQTELTTNWSAGPDGRLPNLDPIFIKDLEEKIDLKFVSDGDGDLISTFGPNDVFNYIYAILHSPTYRIRYETFLKIGFPKIPLTSDLGLFNILCNLGKELVALHLLKASILDFSENLPSYPEVGADYVKKGFPKYSIYKEGGQGYVFINEIQYFEGVPKAVWEFQVGGHQVCEKWLKDRKGRKLSHKDKTHYKRICLALKETIRLMEEIDKAIPEWPIK